MLKSILYIGMGKKSNRQNGKGNKGREAKKYGSPMIGYRIEDQSWIMMINLIDDL
ncbi:hypothetical protein [Xenorhabdus miraniensis]|uniref:hypothetical protein n=1 Tax=Xenorhabdus miraniensis TaxID=351674 RepID=UPI00142DB8C9|nr:hypothetical protein [Xenorhabdus miraniensis]